MFLRVRWFLLGSLSTLAALVWMAGQARRARHRLDASGLVRGGALGVAGALDAAAQRLRTERPTS